jgi:ribonuclease G
LIYKNETNVSNSIREISKRYRSDDFEVLENDEALISYNIDTKLSKFMKKVVYLKSGAWLNVDLTEAMTVIDVNSGKAISVKDKQQNFLKINMEAADMIGRLLRVRNLSGIIIIDFINMKDTENYKILVEHIKEVIGRDSTRTVYIDTTGLGLIELTRQKKSKPLHEVLKG